jgi:glycosyltransferase involved in cell wall biosynthesis
MMSKAQSHIAIYLYSFYDGGAERVIVNLMQSFVIKGIKVDLLVNTKTRSSYFSMVPSEVSIFEFNVGYRKGLSKLISYLKSEQPMVLLSALHFSNEVAILAKHLARVKTRVIVSEHNTLSARSQNASDLKERFEPIAARLFYPWADDVIAVSKAVAKDVRKITGLPKEHIHTIYNPIINEKMLERAQEPLEHPWLQSSEPPVILGVGRLCAQKNFPLLIRAFARVRESQKARLVILGDGPEKENLLSLVNTLGLTQDVDLLGFKPNPYPYLLKATVFVLSSNWEGLPTVLVEAMALGTASISTDCPGGSAEIIEGQDHCELVPSGNEIAMANAISEMLLEERIRKNSLKLNRFSQGKVTSQYLSMLRV